jgi:hypothetical protein
MDFRFPAHLTSTVVVAEISFDLKTMHPFRLSSRILQGKHSLMRTLHHNLMKFILG